MGRNGNNIKQTAKERREHSDKILEEVYAQLISIKKVERAKGKSGVVMTSNHSA